MHSAGLSQRVRGQCGRAAVLAALFTAMLFLLSPDMAIAHGFASCVLLFPRRSGVSQAGPTITAMVACLCGLFGVALRMICRTRCGRRAAVRTACRSRSLPTLCFFAAVFVCACAVVRRMGEPKPDDNTLALVVISIPLLAAALGRCTRLRRATGWEFRIGAAYGTFYTRRGARNVFIVGMLVGAELCGGVVSAAGGARK